MTMPEMSEPPSPSPNAGPPKWLIYGFAAKIVIVTLLTVGILWWKGFIF